MNLDQMSPLEAVRLRHLVQQVVEKEIGEPAARRRLVFALVTSSVAQLMLTFAWFHWA